MNKNRVKRHRMRGKLAQGSEAQKGSKQSYVNTARLGGKLSYLIRGGLSKRTEVSRSHSSRWSNDHPRRLGKLSYRAKGRTDKELSNPKEDSAARQPKAGEKPERVGKEGRRPGENIRGVKDRYQTKRRKKWLNRQESCGKGCLVGKIY